MKSTNTEIRGIIDNGASSVITLSDNSAGFYRSRENIYAATAFIIKVIDTMITKIDLVKEALYLSGINNLRKKVNFLQLYFDLQNGDISAEEYEKELENNPGKYIVDVKVLDSKEELRILNGIIRKLDEDMSVDEVADIFAIDLNFSNIK